jgi:hypothetical protein
MLVGAMVVGTLAIASFFLLGDGLAWMHQQGYFPDWAYRLILHR